MARTHIEGLYDSDGALVGQLCPETGRVLIGGSFYVPERTCRVVRGGEPSPTGVPRERRCSECGGMLTRFGSYCSHCGARVVGRDDA